MEKVWVIARKEWAEVFKNRFVLFAVAFLPLLFTALPLGILYGMQSSGEFSADVAGEFTADLAGGQAGLCAGLDGLECTQYLLITQFILLFMLLPVIIPVTIASYSIVGEKTTRTLEPVLATPITTLQLLGGKALSAVLPAVAVTWGGYALFAAGARILTGSAAVTARLFDPLWLLAILLVGPLLATAAVAIAMMISSRVNDPRVAEQISMLFILPLVALFIGQATGFIFVNETLILWAAGILAVLDVGLLLFATQLFERETILTRWK